MFLCSCFYIIAGENVFLFYIIAGHHKYKDNGHKYRLWTAKAVELGIPVKGLITWFHNQRTKFGRLTRAVGASGSGHKEDSEEDKWCRRSLQYLAPHIGRTHSRKGVDVSYQNCVPFNLYTVQCTISAEQYSTVPQCTANVSTFNT